MNDPDFMRTSPVTLWMKLKRVEATNAELVEVLDDVMSSLKTLGEDGWSEAPYLSRKIHAVLTKAKE